MINYHIVVTDDLSKINNFILPSTFVSLLSTSECVSRGSGGGTVGELAPSLLTAPWMKELLMLAGDVESNPGPCTTYGKNSCDINSRIYYIGSRTKRAQATSSKDSAA